MTIKKRLARSNIAMLVIPVLVAAAPSGCWLLAAGGVLCTKKYRRQGVILLAGLAVGVLVGNVCLGAWLVFAAVRRLTLRSRP